MKLAVIETGGKQFIIKPGDKIQAETIPGDIGAVVVFDKVLLLADGDSVQVGRPHLADAKVEGKILKNGRSDKVLVMKYHNKTRYRRKKGHRQHFTEVEIVKI